MALSDMVEEWAHNGLSNLAHYEEAIDNEIDSARVSPPNGLRFSTILTLVVTNACETLANRVLDDSFLADVLNGGAFFIVEDCIRQIVERAKLDDDELHATNTIVDYILALAEQSSNQIQLEIENICSQLSSPASFFTVARDVTGNDLVIYRTHPRGYVTARIGQAILDSTVLPVVYAIEAEAWVDDGGTEAANALASNPQLVTKVHATQTLMSAPRPNPRPSISPSPATQAPDRGTNWGNDRSMAPMPTHLMETSDRLQESSAPSAVPPIGPALIATWKECPRMLSRRNRCGCAAVGNKLYVFGGYDGKTALSSCEALDSRTNLWSQIPAMPTSRDGCACVAHESKIYVIGGYCKKNFMNPLVFDTESRSWAKAGHLSIPRSDCAATFGMVSKTTNIYIFGGYDGKIDLDSAEYLDVRKNNWLSMPAMPNRRSRCCAAFHEGKIYVMGGYNAGEYLNTVDVFDTKTNRWSRGTPMLSRRCDAAAVVMNSRLYVFGGSFQSIIYDTVEVFDITTGVWEKHPTMFSRRACAAATTFSGKIYVCGGFDGQSCLDSVESMGYKIG